MQNRLFISGDVAVIEVYHRSSNRNFYVLIDSEDIELIHENVKSLSIYIDFRTNYCLYRSMDKKTKGLHRLIMNTPSDLVVDHIEHNGLDNRKRKLRNVTRKANSNNRITEQRNPLFETKFRFL
ncbi:hypothetical protein ABE28_008785 [Peribacillus muralis]|uniref:HNH nuclease domain-containing protein n=1 Tax=Peribacillus muralis TaxID=264697 RepID=A0A1B3XML4_9BACI|nr:hypothetical protein [Peribacillus muralis]AOH54446.1 hypothetical protein ABE28_008785 [Peribacillus muralis]